MVHVLRAYYFFHDGVVALLKRLAFISPLMMRLYLAPVMIAAGLSKVYHLDATAQWFEHSLGLPEPMLMAQLAAYPRGRNKKCDAHITIINRIEERSKKC